MTAMNGRYLRSILIINPNTTEAMTDALKPLVKKLDFDTVRGASSESISLKSNSD